MTQTNESVVMVEAYDSDKQRSRSLACKESELTKVKESLEALSLDILDTFPITAEQLSALELTQLTLDSKTSK